MKVEGAENDWDVVFTSRARFARNLQGIPFVHRATPEHRQRVIDIMTPAIESCSAEPTTWVDLEHADPLGRRLLFEQHLISRPLADASGPRGVAVSHDSALSVMVNEEDHVRMHVIESGLKLQPCFDRIQRLDQALESSVQWAFHPRWGYQSACPTNVGTGIRFSAMLHLPALRLTGELDKMRQAARDLHLAVRGYYGEGSESAGNLYQVSNQVTLGSSEEEVLERFLGTIVPGIVQFERAARKTLFSKNAVQLEDRLHRDLSILRSARLIKVDEAMKRLSMIRLGTALGLMPHLDLQSVSRLFLDIQNGHLQQQAGQLLEQEAMQVARAELLRTRLEAA